VLPHFEAFLDRVLAALVERVERVHDYVCAIAALSEYRRAGWEEADRWFSRTGPECS
jgi:hypothetical protein